MEKIWLKNYPSDVPAEIAPVSETSLADLLENMVTQYADRPAFINMGEIMTYRKLEERSRAFAAYLQNGLGLQKGDRIALMLPNLLIQSHFLVFYVQVWLSLMLIRFIPQEN